MTLLEKITEYKKINHNGKHIFKSGEVVYQNLHHWLDKNYSDAVKEFKTLGTKNIANWLLYLLN